MPLCTKSLAISANCAVGAAYGLQFFLAPGFTIEQNFKVVPDKYHKFMGRFTGGLVESVASPVCLSPHTLPHRSGMCMLTLCKLMKSADEAIVWPVSFAFTACPEQHARLPTPEVPTSALLTGGRHGVRTWLRRDVP